MGQPVEVRVLSTAPIPEKLRAFGVSPEKATSAPTTSMQFSLKPVFIGWLTLIRPAILPTVPDVMAISASGIRVRHIANPEEMQRQTKCVPYPSCNGRSLPKSPSPVSIPALDGRKRGTRANWRNRGGDGDGHKT